MKKKITLAIIIFLIGGITLILVTNKQKADEELFKNKENNFISIMLQDEEGNYKQSDITEFNPEGYHYNSRLSKCVNGSTIKYEDGSIYVKGNTSDRCYAYYDNNNFVEDLSGNGNHGKPVNIANWNEDGITTSDLDTSGYVDCGLAGYDFKNSVSLIVRVKINDFTDNVQQRLFNNYGAPIDWSGVGLAYTNINKKSYISFWDSNTNGWKQISDSEILQINNWYTIVGTYDGNIERLYVNGKIKSKATFVGNIKISQKPFYIGKSSMEEKDYTLSTFTDALIFDRALTEEEIAKDYANDVNPTNKDNLLLWYKFN